MAASAVPFRFDLDFGAPPARRESGRDDAPERAALDAAYANGESAGRASAMASETAALHEALNRLGAQLAAAQQRSEERGAARDRATVELALAIGTKLAGAALERFPLAGIEKLAAEGFAEAREAPHVVVRVADGLVDTVKARLAAIAAERGFTGKIMVLGEPDIAPGDARLEWADGGMVHSRAALAAALDQALAAFLAAQPDEPA